MNENNNDQENVKPLNEMTKEERTNYSLKRAPDYHGKEENVLNKSRTQCWEARDKYYKCLDDNNDNEPKCKEFYDELNKNCLKSWSEYFVKKRKSDKNIQAFLNRKD
ncbi:hypothetical protein RB653_006897 [Dictyostelium firmibasis]|uniref:Uncharacterized protein n=1 Tax=Dictyostelium firmibasis TaxID=79012 RepID=A0AAN7U2X3_9MYCE